MEVLKKYKHFINESVDSDKELHSIGDVPTEVIETAKRIATDNFDRAHKPIFEYIKNKGLVMKFTVSEQDFRYVDEEENLLPEFGSWKQDNKSIKRTLDVSLIFLDKITETFEVQYLVTFGIMKGEPINDEFDDDDEDVIVDDDYEKPDPDEEYFDEDEADMNIKKGKIRIDDEIDLNDIDPTGWRDED